MKTSYVKIRKKTVEWEGGENQKTMKAIMYEWVGKEVMKDLEDVVIYTKEIKEKKEDWRNTYLVGWWLTWNPYTFYLA